MVFDELTAGVRQDVQAAVLRVFQERYAGDLALADTVHLVAAANSPDQAAGGYEIEGALANRFCHLNWAFDAAVWAAGMMTGFEQLPAHSVDQLACGTEASQASAFGAVTAFTTRHRPDLLQPGMPANPVLAGRAWASPRAWHNAARVLGELTPGDVEAPLVAVTGLVGEGPGAEFAGWEQTNDLPDVEMVLADPHTVDWAGERPDRLFALCTAINALGAAGDPGRWVAAVAALTGCAQASRADVALNATEMLLRRIPAGQRLPVATRRVFADLMIRAELLAA